MAEPKLDSFGRFKNPEDAKAADKTPKKGATYDLAGGKTDALGRAVTEAKRSKAKQGKAE